jgi:periplasmic protein TonB
VVRISEIGPAVPRLPQWRWSWSLQVAGSVSLHVIVAAVVVALAGRAPSTAVHSPSKPTAPQPVDARRLVFIARSPLPVSGGGGGGGNRQARPIRRAQGVGSDKITLRTRKPASVSEGVESLPALPSVVLDAKPLASGTYDQIGLPTGGVSFGTSTGPGSGGGVGEGVGTGIGSGRGPGIGPGTGGGIGGGVYRPGGAVTPPRVLTEVKPTYTNEALSRKVQGSVVLELVVRRDGRPSEIHVIRSLDPGGLDEQAVLAVRQWRFEPGRLAAAPVDVLVTVVLDFWIR